MVQLSSLSNSRLLGQESDGKVSHMDLRPRPDGKWVILYLQLYYNL